MSADHFDDGTIVVEASGAFILADRIDAIRKEYNVRAVKIFPNSEYTVWVAFVFHHGKLGVPKP